MGYCLNLYCTGLSQDNHWKYSALAQIGLNLVNGLVILKLIFIIAKRKKRKKQCSRYKNQTNFLLTMSHSVLQVWVHTASFAAIFIWTFCIFFLPQVHPSLSLHLTIFILLIKSTAFQKLSVTNSNSFPVLSFLSSTEGTSTAKFCNYV